MATSLSYPLGLIDRPYQAHSLGFKQEQREKLSPIVKWAGGKEKELKYILPNLPDTIDSYYEPFVGGGAVFTSIEVSKYYINDKSVELISLYRNLIGADSRSFFSALDEIIYNWDTLTQVVKTNTCFFIDTYKAYSDGLVTDERTQQILFEFILYNSSQFHEMFSDTFRFNNANFLNELRINIFRKIKRMRMLEQTKHTLPDADIAANIETALKSAFYMQFRHIYNNVKTYRISEPVQSAIFLYIRNFAYSGMFRYNALGQFNVPYGGIGYNGKNFKKKVDYLRSEGLQNLLQRTSIDNLDFETFLRRQAPKTNDFVFIDPPYDSEFSTYAQNKFNRLDQERLASYLTGECLAKWMIVIKNTDFISRLYSGKELNIKRFDKTYLVSFMNRNDKNTEHLLITNY